MNGFTVIPSIDLLDGKVVRLLRGNFEEVTQYGDPISTVERWQIPMGVPVHVVDLEASRKGTPTEVKTISKLAQLGYPTQIGGGVRSVDDAKLWIDAGASTLVIGTIAAEDPVMLEEIVRTVGAKRVLAAVDMTQGVVRVSGWEESSSKSAPMIFEHLEKIGLTSVLITDISRDGTMEGPNFRLYREIRELTKLRVIASGGVGTLEDITSLARIPALDGVVIGKALHERTFTWAEAHARAMTAGSLPAKVVPVMEIRDGRLMNGYPGTRDPGSPSELAARWEADGADEILIIERSETTGGTEAGIDVVREIATRASVPIVAGGGISTRGQVARLREAGADRVLIATAELDLDSLAAAVVEYGSGAIVARIDVRNDGAEISAAGQNGEELDLSVLATRLDAMGVGEILMAFDRDGDRSFSHVPALRTVGAAVRTGVSVLMNGASREPMLDAIEAGGVRGVAIRDLGEAGSNRLLAIKDELQQRGIPTRHKRRSAP